MACIILGVTGSIAAYKAADIASALVKYGHEVHCVCTAKALEFVTPLTLHTISRNPVFSSFEDEKTDWVPPHIQLAQRADLLLIAPATANTMANFAHGLPISSAYLPGYERPHVGTCGHAAKRGRSEAKEGSLHPRPQ